MKCLLPTLLLLLLCPLPRMSTTPIWRALNSTRPSSTRRTLAALGTILMVLTWRQKMSTTPSSLVGVPRGPSTLSPSRISSLLDPLRLAVIPSTCPWHPTMLRRWNAAHKSGIGATTKEWVWKLSTPVVNWSEWWVWGCTTPWQMYKWWWGWTVDPLIWIH